MTLPILPRGRARSFEAVDRLLARRWVQALLFTLVLVAAWLLGTRTAQAEGAEGPPSSRKIVVLWQEAGHLAVFSN